MFAESRKIKKNTIINITPLIDVVFQLVIFFAVTTTFVEKPAIELILPHAKTAQLSRAEETVITLDKDGNIFFNSTNIDPKELRTKLSEMQLSKSGAQIVLQADERVAYKTVVFVMDTARETGFKNVVSLTMPPDGR